MTQVFITTVLLGSSGSRVGVLPKSLSNLLQKVEGFFIPLFFKQFKLKDGVVNLMSHPLAISHSHLVGIVARQYYLKKKKNWFLSLGYSYTVSSDSECTLICCLRRKYLFFPYPHILVEDLCSAPRGLW